MGRAPTSLTSQQTSTKHYLIFNQFETMDTQPTREGLPANRLNWLENLQPIGPNFLKIVPAPAAPMATIAGQTFKKQFYANFNNQDHIIGFTLSGAGYDINIPAGTNVQFAGPGTFTSPDVTQWQSSRVLIADASAGYCTWDGTVFVKAGGVSPNIIVTAGGSGYTSGATAAITGGSGSGATATVQVVGGVVVSVTLTNAGVGYKAGDVLTVTITPVGAGSGATATAIVWPILAINPTTLAVFQGRVWMASVRTLFWTGTKGFDDSAAANASGSTVLPDSDLVHQITALRSLNNYLYIFGDNSIKQIGTVSVSGSVTLFTIITLSSDQGTTFPQSIASYNRLILFANRVGVYAIFGASVEKISDQMDGVFQLIDFAAQDLQAGVIDINSIHCYCLLARYQDPIQNVTRSILVTFMNKKWFVVAQGNSVTCIASAPLTSGLQLFASSGADITRILASATTAVSILMRTALADDNKLYMGKKILRVVVVQRSQSSGTMALTADTENGSLPFPYTVQFPITWVNAAGAVITWVNALAQVITFTGSGFLWQRVAAAGTGVFLGASLSGSFVGFSVNSVIIEYQETTALASRVDT